LEAGGTAGKRSEVAATRVRGWAETAPAKVMTEAIKKAVNERGILGPRKAGAGLESSASGRDEGARL
jgi:hypothetical protein